MSSNRVRISEGPLPEGVTIRAVEHERAGTNHRAWVARHRARQGTQKPTMNLWPDGGAAPLVNLEQVGALPSKEAIPDVPAPLIPNASVEVPAPPPLATLRHPAESKLAPATPSTPEIPSMPTLRPVELRGPTPEAPATNDSVPVRFGTPK